MSHRLLSPTLREITAFAALFLVVAASGASLTCTGYLLGPVQFWTGASNSEQSVAVYGEYGLAGFPPLA